MASVAFRKIDLRQAAASQPYFVYARVSLAQPRVYTVYEVPYGFNYLLRRVVSRWDGAAVGINNGLSIPAELFNSAQSRPRQNEPIPVHLFSSPAGDNQAVAVPGAPLGIQFFATPRTSARIVNIAFPYGDAVRVVVSNPDIPGAAVQFFDIVLEGYLIPENSLGMWGGSAGGA